MRLIRRLPLAFAVLVLAAMPASCRGRRLAPRPVALGRAALRGRLQAFRLRQPERAEGRRRAARLSGHLRQPQPRRRRREGRARGSHRAHLRHADDELAGRGRHRIRPPRRGGALPGRFLVGDLPPACGGALARRHAGDARRRDLLLRGPQGEQPAIRLLLQERHAGRADRRARGHLHLRREGQPRAAADRRPASGPAEALVGGNRAGRKEARRHANDPGAAARLGSVSAEGVRSRAARRSTSACADYWGKDLPVNVGKNNFARDPQRVFPRRHRHAGGVQGRSARLPSGERAPATGRRPTTSRPCATGGWCWRSSPSARAASCRPSCSTCAGPSSRTSACAAPSTSRSTYEDINRTLFFGQYERINSFFEGTELASEGLPQGKELAILESLRDKVPPEVFTTPYQKPGRRQRGGAARQPARGAFDLLKEAGYEQRGRQLVQQGPASPSLSSSSASTRPSSATCCPTSRRSSGSASASPYASSTPRSTRTALRSLRFRHRHRGSGRSPCRPATSSATIGARTPPTGPARATSPASRMRASTRSSTG